MSFASSNYKAFKLDNPKLEILRRFELITSFAKNVEYELRLTLDSTNEGKTTSDDE